MRRLLIAHCLLALTVGCGPGAPPPEGIAPDPNMSPVADSQLKQMLEEIAKSGEAGSAAAALRPSIEAINVANPGKGAGLLSDLSQLESASNAEQVKQIAKRMSSKL